jgi:MOSC domain-containing protein
MMMIGRRLMVRDDTGGVAVGRVVGLYRFPVKSMRGEAVERARTTWHGIEGDRRYAFVREDDRSGYPWFTARKVPQMLRYTPFLVDPADPQRSPVRVRTPDGRELDVESSELLDEITGGSRYDAYLMHLRRGAVDSAPVSLISTQTVRAIGEAAGQELEPRRFRMNVVVEAFSDQPGEEDGWLGSTITFGERDDSLRLRARRRDVRCMMINLDPETAVQQPAVLRTVVRQRDQCAGIYTWPEGPGSIEVGDQIRLDPVMA